jgi:hypothetical protein
MKTNKELHHPCMDVCSGWQQGYDEGELRGRQDALRECLKICDKEITDYFYGYDRISADARAAVSSVSLRIQKLMQQEEPSHLASGDE